MEKSLVLVPIYYLIIFYISVPVTETLGRHSSPSLHYFCEVIISILKQEFNIMCQCFFTLEVLI